MKQLIEKKIQALLNKNLKYGVRVVTFTGYHIDEQRGRVFIHTTERDNHFDRPLDAISSFLKEFEPTDLPTIAGDQSKASAIMMNTATSLGQQLQAVLMENIDKVRQDASYIPQATVVNNNVNSLINLTKMQLDYFKTAERLKEEGR